MILIDENTESKLAVALEALKANPDSSRCIYFNLKDKPIVGGIKEAVIESTKKYIGAITPQIYLCGDGDIFILAPSIPSKDGRDLLLNVATYAGQPVNDTWVEFVEVSLHINKLLSIVEAKLEKKRQIEETKNKLLEQQQAQRKRQEILGSDALVMNAATIDSRRKERAAPEIMIIEDDAFSRRLVDNVLAKQFSMTGLDKADLALPTYAKIAPDVLFLDINLPDVTGLELLEKFIKLDPNAYIIMLSGNADKENIMHAMSHGAKGFVAKPFNKEKLFQYIERCPSIALRQRSVGAH